MAAFLRRNSYRGGKSPAVLLARLRAAPQAPLSLPAATLTAMVHTHVQQLRSLQAAITGIEHLIADRVTAYPRAQLLNRLPGVGTINLAQLLAEVGPILDRASSAEQAASECGTAPVTRASGKTTGVYFRWASQHPRPQGHHRLRPQRPDAITVGRQALRRRPGPRQAQPPRHPHRRPSLDPRHLGLLAHRRRLRPRHPPSPAAPHRLRT